MRLVIVGAGRAGGSVAIAADRAGHQVVGVVTREGTTRFGPAVAPGEPVPDCDILLIAVRDDDIADVAAQLPSRVGNATVAAHLSGFVPVTALEPLSPSSSLGGIHPLQTLPDPDAGSAALPGSYAGIGGEGVARRMLTELAESLDMSPFLLPDEVRPEYHAAAAAVSNFVVTALGTGSDLFAAAGIDPGVARPLVDSVVGNVFERGAAESLTGPIARGDDETVAGHLEAAARVSNSVGAQYRLMAEATAMRAGRDRDRPVWS